MKQKAKLSIIGAFVLGACLLAAGMVVTFGAGTFFTEKQDFVLYFEDSLKGLDVGAPVRFMGVKVGKVTGIDLVFDKKSLNFWTPVFIEVETGRITLRGDDSDLKRSLGSMDEAAFQRELINRGLRAQLKIDSLLTGMLYVDIGFYPDKPYTAKGDLKNVQELPTIISGISELSKTLENMPLESLVNRLTSAVESVDRILTRAEETHTLENMNGAVLEFRGLMKQLSGAIDPITGSIEGAAEETRKLAATSEAGVKKTLEAFQGVAASSQSMVETLQETLESLEGTLGPDSTVTYRLNRMLGDVSEAARAMRTLADYLERHPEALVFGKGRGE